MSVLQVIAMVLCVGAFVAAARLAVAGRGAIRRDEPGGVSTLVGALAVMVLSYHGFAWSAPAGWAPLQVPADRWWLVVAGAGLAYAGARAADTLEGRAVEDRQADREADGDAGGRDGPGSA